jgi:hypothetical protein
MIFRFVSRISETSMCTMPSLLDEVKSIQRVEALLCCTPAGAAALRITLKTTLLWHVKEA